jgi:RNA recognition motif. (a.k.a. RRM, RBD, or RNP domain)
MWTSIYDAEAACHCPAGAAAAAPLAAPATICVGATLDRHRPVRAAALQSRGYGFVHMSNEETARAAADGMHGKMIEGRAIVARLRSGGRKQTWKQMMKKCLHHHTR